jgi:hypothetical protein
LAEFLRADLFHVALVLKILLHARLRLATYQHLLAKQQWNRMTFREFAELDLKWTRESYSPVRPSYPANRAKTKTDLSPEI